MVNWTQVENALDADDVTDVENEWGVLDLDSQRQVNFMNWIDGETPDLGMAFPAEKQIEMYLDSFSETEYENWLNSHGLKGGDGEPRYSDITIGDMKDLPGADYDNVAGPLMTHAEARKAADEKKKDAIERGLGIRPNRRQVGAGIIAAVAGYGIWDQSGKDIEGGEQGPGDGKTPVRTETEEPDNTPTETVRHYPDLHYTDPKLEEIQSEHDSYHGQLEEIIALKGDIVSVEYNERTDEFIAKTSPNEYTSIDKDVYKLLKEEKF